MKGMIAVFKRELLGYFVTPVAYVFIVIFLVLTGVFTFEIGGFYERGQADLRPFFDFHPWLYLFLIPAVSMRLWAEERRGGTIELLLTLPLALWATVAGKFLAAWAFTGIALVLTFPTWITVNVLGDPDNGAIVTGYIGSFLMAGGFLAIGSCVSAMSSPSSSASAPSSRASRPCSTRSAAGRRRSWSTPSRASASSVTSNRCPRACSTCAT
jgi:ABC-2 type transport system permease protein